MGKLLDLIKREFKKQIEEGWLIVLPIENDLLNKTGIEAVLLISINLADLALVYYLPPFHPYSFEPRYEYGYMIALLSWHGNLVREFSSATTLYEAQVCEILDQFFNKRQFRRFDSEQLKKKLGKNFIKEFPCLSPIYEEEVCPSPSAIRKEERDLALKIIRRELKKLGIDPLERGLKFILGENIPSLKLQYSSFAFVTDKNTGKVYIVLYNHQDRTVLVYLAPEEFQEKPLSRKNKKGGP